MKRLITSLLIFTTATLLLAAAASAAPPHPELVSRIQQGQADAPYFLANIKQMRARQINSGLGNQLRLPSTLESMGAAKTANSEFRALALLVEFTDQPKRVEAEFFDSLIFSDNGQTVRDYYQEVSYGKIDIVTLDLPASVGWQTAPETYEYYVNSRNGTGAYPRNSQKLVEDLVDAVDSEVDFSKYDNDGDGYVDVLMVIHSGSGAEFSGSDDDIWSHEWQISPRYKDGVAISTFTIQPEYWTRPGDMTIGVCCHELGHGFGLPDLYDTDYSSYGIGRWCLMAYGTWLGPSGRGSRPAHLSAWCKKELGVLEPINPTSNATDQTLPPVEDSAKAWRLWNAGEQDSEYFLLENRQKTGYDAYLPGHGLLIWHIDESRTGNSHEYYPGMNPQSHPLVALEQADGYFSLEKKTDAGEAHDAFPGPGLQTEFSLQTVPGSESYTDGPTSVSVTGISEDEGIITADLVVGLSGSSDNDDDGDQTPVPKSPVLSQNYPNPFNPSTTISFSLPDAGNATLEIYDISGRKVATLVDGPVEAGVTEVKWGGRDDRGRPVASGVYFYRLEAGDDESTSKMVLTR
jgi:immune inhibitor A